MKLVQLDVQTTWRGGEQQVLYLSEWLRARNIDSVLVCQPHGILRQRAQAIGLPVMALRVRHELDIAAAWRLARYLRRQRAQVLHMHDPHAHTLGLLAGILVPHVRKVVSRRVDFAPRRHLFSRWKYTRADVYYLAVSEAVRRVLLASGVAPTQVQTVYSGIDLHRFSAVPAVPLPFAPGTLIIGTVGHLAGHKGHCYLLEAFRQVLHEVPQAGLVIVGTGALFGALQAQAEALGISNQVYFTGFRQDVLALMQRFDIFAFSSYLEGLGTAVLDAMALGKPVVATCAGGIPEVVRHGMTGLLVPPRDPAAMAQALVVLLRHPERRHVFGEAGRKRVEQYFTVERMASQTLQVYQRILSHAHTPA